MCDFKEFPLIAFNKFPGDRALRILQALRWNKLKPWERIFSGSLQTGQVVIVLCRWNLGKISKPLLACPVALGLLGFTTIIVSIPVSFQRYHRRQRRKLDYGKLKHYKAHCSFWDSDVFPEKIFCRSLQALVNLPFQKRWFWQFLPVFFLFLHWNKFSEVLNPPFWKFLFLHLCF